MKVVILILSSLISASALASQCAWNKRADVRSGLNLLKNSEIILWCQNCNEKRPSHILKIKDVKLDKAANTDYEVSVVTDMGPLEIDLGYTYVKTASDTFTNVSHLVGCPTQGSTTFVQTGPGSRKVSYLYTKEGVRVNTSTQHQEVRVTELAWMKENRKPASK